MENRVPDIVNCFYGAKMYADLFAEENPEKAEAARKLIEELGRIQREFMTAINYGEK